ncbi:MAG: DNA polymerase III subunit delta' [Burkholderiaceae bacterium]|nr:DNA polymerase III subunit delta' [Burkholderiaceae bacterium]
MSNEAAPLAPWLAVQRDRLLAQRGHAWLLQGASGLGQYDLALSLARAWLCEAPTGQGACGQCGSCHAIDVRTHADLAVLMPETRMMETGWPLSEKAQQEIDDKKRKPSNEIRVEALRDAVEFSQRTSARGRGKAVLVFPAERMNTISANALLKTLEEPPGDVKFVLASEAAHLLLPTIRSRCLGHAMVWPAQGEALAWLIAQGVAEADAPVLLRAAGGRPADALRDWNAGRRAKTWSLLPRAMSRGDVAAISDQAPSDAVETLHKLCHDLMAVEAGAGPRFFDAADLPRPPSRRALGVWSKSLAQAGRTSEHPFNAGLMLESLVSEARKVLNSRAIP